MASKFFKMTTVAQLFKLFTVLTVVLFLSLPAAAYAVEITYDGGGKSLHNSPSWFTTPVSLCLFPGTSRAPLASGNKITIDYDPQAVGVKNPVFVSGGLSSSKSTSGNCVVLMNGRVEKIIYGGFSEKAGSKNNAVVLGGGFVEQSVGGGYGHNHATDNSVTVSGGTVGSAVFGGYSEGDATNNTVTISNGTVCNGVFGGWGEGDTTNNIVTISGGSVAYTVYGGASRSKDASDNVVTVSGGSIGGSVNGGYGENDATGNTVTISGGSVGRAVHGGVGSKGNATGNAVTISGVPDLAKASIYGGQTNGGASKDDFTGNTLNFKTSGISVEHVGYFEYYNFYLPENWAEGVAMLRVEKTVDLAGTIVGVFLEGSAELRQGDKLVLIHSDEGVKNSPQNKSCKAGQGGALYEFSIGTDRNKLWAEVTNIVDNTK